ncbi:hypothetical protein P3T73_05060 [Kiritimatiellota bacterium B12222]|nr:hypothetical protein P3T73_05060 [Kiritimatiellota bacterium B12222]
MTTTSPFHRGMTFGFYAPNGYYSSANAQAQVDKMATLNIEWVCLVVTVLQESYASGRQFRDFAITPADDEIRDIIDYIHQQGMKVQLRPMLECWDGTQRIHIRFPADTQIIPGKPVTHCSRWFESMTQRTLHYARLATRAGCEAYGLDSELDNIVDFNTQWKEVVSAARSAFNGHLTSSHTPGANFEKQLTTPHHWWFDLDSLGTSFYHPVSNRAGSSIEEMVTNLQEMKQHHRRIAGLYGKPYYFGEIGCCSTAGATRKPYGWDNPGGYDGGEQAQFLEAIFRTFWEEPWWMGMYWWKWDEQNDRPWFRDDPAGDKGFILDGKPAAKIMQEWYGRKDRS